MAAGAASLVGTVLIAAVVGIVLLLILFKAM